MSDTRTVHLFREGLVITACCRRSIADARVRSDLGTYDRDAATCEALEPQASHPWHPWRPDCTPEPHTHPESDDSGTEES